MLFVKDLMSHKEALELLQLLQGELVDYFAQGETASMISIMSKVDLLEVYTSTFKGDSSALAQIKQILSTGEELYAKDAITHGEETKNLRTDNSRGALDLDDYDYTDGGYSVTGNLEADINGLVQQLLDHMAESIVNLEDNEIQAAHDFAKWSNDIEKENVENQASLDAKRVERTELDTRIEDAEGGNSAAETRYNDAVKAREDMENFCAEQNTAYTNESSVRNSELTDVEACLRLFENELLGDNTTQYTKDRAEGVTEENEASWDVHDTTNDRT